VSALDSQLSLSTYAGDDKNVLRRFRTEMISRGFRSDSLDRHTDVLQAYMMRLDQSGVLDEAAMQSANNRPAWCSNASFRLTNTSLPRSEDMFGLSEKDEENVLTKQPNQQVSGETDSVEVSGDSPTSHIAETRESTITPKQSSQNVRQAGQKLPENDASIQNHNGFVTQWLNHSSDKYAGETDEVALGSSQPLRNQRSREYIITTSELPTAQASHPQTNNITPKIQTPPSPYAESSYSDLEDLDPMSSQTTLKGPVTSRGWSSRYTRPQLVSP
jgi:hypothetical protein